MIKNAHENYYLRFEALGDNPSKEELKELLNAIQSGIKSGKLTKKTCDMYIVDMMEWVIITTLNESTEAKNFYLHRAFPPIPRPLQYQHLRECQSSKEKTKVKNAHEKYYLQFEALGTKPSKEALEQLLNAIHAGIDSGELTKKTCEPYIVAMMQSVIIATLHDANESKTFTWHRAFPPVPRNTQFQYLSKCQSSKEKTKVKTKPKAKVSKVKVKVKEQPKEKSKVQVTKVITLKPRSAITLKPSSELHCTLQEVPNTSSNSSISAEKTTNTLSLAKAKLIPKTTGRQKGVLIKSAKSIAEQEYNFFKAGDFSEVLGEVAVPFSLMVSGVPGSGKTSFLLQLIRHVSKAYPRQKLLFVSNEERFNPSLGAKLKRFNMLGSDNLDISEHLPSDLTNYSFIFLDSVQSLRLSVEDFKSLISKLTSSGICLFFVFQATKSGSFRGSLEYEHEVDISLKVEKGQATVVKNRFGGSGYYKIF